MVPAQVSGTHSVVGQAVKRYLLDIEISVKEEAAAIYHNKGDEHQKGEAKPQEKGFQKVVVPKAPFFSLRDSIKARTSEPDSGKGGAPACL